MKCFFCKAEPTRLFQVVMKINKEADTSAFEYRLVCGACVKERDLEKSVIREKRVPRD